jgi:hypothetical protein
LLRKKITNDVVGLVPTTAEKPIKFYPASPSIVIPLSLFYLKAVPKNPAQKINSNHTRN